MSISSTYCEDTNSRGTYSEFAILLPICILFQILLFFNSIHNEFNRLMQYMDRKIRLSFILIQIISLYFMISGLFRFAIDPYTLILRGNVGCKMMALSHKIYFIYYSVYFYHIIIRLTNSFKDSQFALNRSTIILLHTFNLLPLITLIPLIIHHIITHTNDLGCIKLWNPPDIRLHRDNFSYCASPLTINDVFIGPISLLWIIVSNIMYFIIFGRKLKELLARGNQPQKGLSIITFNCKVIGIKVVVLTLFGSVSSLVNLSLCMFMNVIGYQLGVGTIFGHLDMMLNCYAIGLMFKSNEKYYTKLSKCCILRCCKNNVHVNQCMPYLETRSHNKHTPGSHALEVKTNTNGDSITNIVTMTTSSATSKTPDGGPELQRDLTASYRNEEHSWE